MNSVNESIDLYHKAHEDRKFFKLSIQIDFNVSCLWATGTSLVVAVPHLSPCSLFHMSCEVKVWKLLGWSIHIIWSKP
jgi:hypothetical protein